MYPLPTPLFGKGAVHVESDRQTEIIGEVTSQLKQSRLPLNGKVKVANSIVLICLDHNCSQMSNAASLMHQNKSESEKTGKGGWFQYLIQMRILS